MSIEIHPVLILKCLEFIDAIKTRKHNLPPIAENIGFEPMLGQPLHYCGHPLPDEDDTCRVAQVI